MYSKRPKTRHVTHNASPPRLGLTGAEVAGEQARTRADGVVPASIGTIGSTSNGGLDGTDERNRERRTADQPKGRTGGASKGLTLVPSQSS